MRLTPTERDDVERVAHRVQLLVTYGRSFSTSLYSSEDAYQAAMEAVCRARKRWDPRLASFPTYAQARAQGAIVDFYRSQRPGTRADPAERPLSIDRIPDAGYEDPEPHDPLLERQIHAAIDVMPANQARAFRLVEEADMTVREAADVLGVTAGRVRQHLTQARAMLAPRVERLIGGH